MNDEHEINAFSHYTEIEIDTSWMDQDRGIQFLESQGINLFHAFDTKDVLDLFEPALPEFDFEEYQSTVLLGNAGSGLWHALQDYGMDSADPVDDFSVYLANQFSAQYLDTSNFILYPSSYPISLLNLGMRCGWAHTTPMGISIHPKFGTWFAYRALFLVKKKLEKSVALLDPHPCESCVDKPCQPICPSGAVREIGFFGLNECTRYRIQDDSRCSRGCLSRLRCPVGSEHRYVPEQMKYHYFRSQQTILRYYSSAS